MNFLKKIILTVVALIIVTSLSLTLIGCPPAAPVVEEETTPAAEEAAPTEEELAEEFEIVLVVKLEGVSWFDDTRRGIEQFAADYGVNAYQVGADTGDPAKQVALTEDLIAKGVDAILVIPNDPKSMEPVLKKANEAGIITVAHEASSMENISYDIEAFDNERFGELMMENLVEQMGSEGKYGVIVGAHTMETHMQWADASVAWQKENYPDMELVTDPYLEDENDEQLSYDRIAELLKAVPDIKGIRGNTACSSPQAAQIIKEKGLVGKVFISGLSLPSFAYKYIEDGTLKYIHCWSPASAAYVSALVAYKTLKGEEISAGMDLKRPGYENVKIVINSFGVPVIYGDSALTITKDNIDEYPF